MDEPNVEHHPVLLTQNEGAWLCEGSEIWAVDGEEFRAWAAYSGISLEPARRPNLDIVVLATPIQRLLFDGRWRASMLQASRSPLR